MKPPTNRTATRALAFDGLGRRLALSWLMVISILLVSLASSLSAHATPSGGFAIGGQVFEGKAGLVNPGSADQAASFDDNWDSTTDCTDHCGSHGLSLPAPASWFEPAGQPSPVWRLTATPFLPDGASARLERPPRL